MHPLACHIDLLTNEVTIHRDLRLDNILVNTQGTSANQPARQPTNQPTPFELDDRRYHRPHSAGRLWIGCHLASKPIRRPCSFVLWHAAVHWYARASGPAGQRALYPRLLAHFFAVLSLSLPIAPEVLTDTQERGHGFSVDWWSYGIILFYLLTLEVRRWLTATLSLADGSLTSLVFLLLTPQTSLVSISTREPYGSLRCYCQGKHQLG